jgi:hypothetical protein
MMLSRATKLDCVVSLILLGLLWCRHTIWYNKPSGFYIGNLVNIPILEPLINDITMAAFLATKWWPTTNQTTPPPLLIVNNILIVTSYSNTSPALLIVVWLSFGHHKLCNIGFILAFMKVRDLWRVFPSQGAPRGNG